MIQSEHDDRRMYNTLTVFALLIRCPAGGGGNALCPFAKFRTGRELEEKFIIAESLSDEKCREMLSFHDRCLAGATTTIYMPMVNYHPEETIGKTLEGVSL